MMLFQVPKRVPEASRYTRLPNAVSPVSNNGFIV
jgi:hypothetical protein